MRAPPYPLEGVVSWNMNTTCNYRCTYCTQRFLDDRKAWARDLPRFIAAFTALPGDWEIKLSGGEPFQHPSFEDTIAGLADGGLRVSAVTNLSAPRERLAAFARLTQARPGVLSASLHLEYVDPDAFLDTLDWMAERYAGRLFATCVATRDNLARLPALRERFAARGHALQVQPEKQDRDVIAYSPAEIRAIEALGGHCDTGHLAPDFEGRPCWAGARYFIVDHVGHAYRCYPARRYRKEYLGNVLDGSLRLSLGATPCAYAYCNCTVPQKRGMIAEVGSR